MSMKKHTPYVDRTPKAGVTIPLVVTRIIEVPADQVAKPAANQRSGKVNYQAKPKAAKQAPQTPQRVERKLYGKGQYIGNGDRLTAFVWLDDETAPKGEAANDPEVK
jgi:hypothetical protein